MQENPISNSLSKTDSNEASNPIRSLMPFRYGPLCYAIVDVEIGLTDHRMPNTSLRIDKFLGGWSTRSTSRPCSFLNVPITGS